MYEQDREREGKHGRVRRSEEAALAAVRDASRGIRERRVRDQRKAELAECEEDRERERIVAVASCRARSAKQVATISGPNQLPGRRDQTAMPAARNAQAATTPAAARFVVVPGSEVVDLDVVCDEPEHDAAEDEGQAEVTRAHREIVTRRTSRDNGETLAGPGACPVHGGPRRPTLLESRKKEVIMSIPQRAAIVVSVSLALLFSFPAVAGADNVDRGLLEMYQPVTYLDPAEQFGPASVQSFVSDSDLERFDAGSWSLADPAPEPGDLPGPGTGTWRLNQDSCTPSLPLGGLACYAGRRLEGTGASVVYGRVARQPGAIVLEYWYFYYDDVYSYTYPASDFIWQAHEGDWENVDVVSRTTKCPSSSATASIAWGRGALEDTTPLLGTHPIAHVAAGSHANYF